MGVRVEGVVNSIPWKGVLELGFVFVSFVVNLGFCENADLGRVF